MLWNSQPPPPPVIETRHDMKNTQWCNVDIHAAMCFSSWVRRLLWVWMLHVNVSEGAFPSAGAPPHPSYDLLQLIMFLSLGSKARLEKLLTRLTSKVTAYTATWFSGGGWLVLSNCRKNVRLGFHVHWSACDSQPAAIISHNWCLWVWTSRLLFGADY